MRGQQKEVLENLEEVITKLREGAYGINDDLDAVSLETDIEEILDGLIY